jgi:tRNA A-37 threonylcarbamoyl transferase component Bud32
MKQLITQLQTSKPVAVGGFSELHVLNGRAVKILEDACYLDVLKECYLQNLAADAGFAPRVHAVAELVDEVIVVMDVIDTNAWFHPDACDDIAPTLLGELPTDQMEVGLKLFCGLLKAGLIHADFHSGNWFMNEANETMAIDFGIASEIQDAPETHLKRAVQFLIPALHHLGYDYLAENLESAWYEGLDATRQELTVTANEII